MAEKKNKCEGETRRKKKCTPFLPESKCALSMRGLAQLVKSQIKFFRLTFYGPWATPCQESTPSPCILLVFSLLEPLRFGRCIIHCTVYNKKKKEGVLCCTLEMLERKADCMGLLYRESKLFCCGGKSRSGGNSLDCCCCCCCC